MIRKPIKIKQIVDDGFSSDQDQRQQILYEFDKIEIPQIVIKNQNKFILEPPKQIEDKYYSLHPDIMTGWIPKIALPDPIPTAFNNDQLDNLINYIARNQNMLQIQLCYLGPRYQSTFYSWYDKQFQFPYKHINPPKNIMPKNRLFCGQSQNYQNFNYLQFDSFFESGNLDCALKIGQYQYQLFMRIDSNTRGHLQWYNFKVTNLIKGKTYKFYISNFQKGNILYTRGMKPYIYSLRKFQQTKLKWEQGGFNVKYGKKIAKSCQISGFQQEDKLYRLSFDYTCTYDNDTVQMAYCIPYTYSDLKQYIGNLQQRTLNDSILKVSKLCTSLGGLDVPLISITNNILQSIQAQKNKRKQQKRIVVVSGRAHPGQSNGSYLVQGFIDFLCSSSQSANFLRQKIIFKIIPMLNPDGVALGNFRTGLSGKDFNRQFINPDKVIFPQIYTLKELVRQLKQLYRKNFFMFLDFHGHSVKKNIFMYGPEFPIVHKNYYECRMFPKLISLQTQMFRYYSCTFKVSQFKQSTARAVLFKHFNIPLTYTIEASNGFYYLKQQLKDQMFQQKDWILSGQNISEALYNYLKIVIDTQTISLQKLQQRKAYSQKKQQLRKQRMKMKAKLNNTQRYLVKTASNLIRNKERQINNHNQSSIPYLKNSQDNSNLLQILDSIKNQNQFKEKFRNSDDQISQGSSDKQNSDNDLDCKAMQDLINRIKHKKNTNRNCRRRQKKSRLYTEIQLKKQTSNNQIEDENFEDNQKMIMQMKSRQITMKRHLFLKRRASLISTPSPKKQQKMPIAKIVNFSFGLTSMNSKVKLEPNQKKQNSIKHYQTDYDNDLSSRKVSNRKGLDFSQTFKRTFLSVQRQILKRQLKKVKNPKQNYNFERRIIEDIKGKKIKILKQK